MYFFNKKLLENLPCILGIKQKDFKKQVGVAYTTYRRWLQYGVSSMAMLADIINRLHLSFADFIVTEENPAVTQSKEYYLIPEDKWQPVEWMPHKIASLYGKNGITGIPTKFAFAKKIGLSCHQRLDRWMLEESPVPVDEFLSMVNTLQIDARILIKDPNKEIVKPVFGWEKTLRTEKVCELEAEVDKLRSELVARDKRIIRLNKELASARKEIVLKEGLSTNRQGAGLVAEGAYPFPIGKRGYVFHKELWKALPEVFDFKARDLCLELGLRLNTFSLENVKVDTAIKICNHLRMSFTHLLRPINEPSIIRNKGSYAISPNMFKPIENQLYNLRYVFHKDTFDLQAKDLVSIGIYWDGKESFMKEDGKRSMMVTLANICTEFNIPPSVFIYDENKKRAAYSVSLNETLIRNCIKMAEIIASLKQGNKSLREELNTNSD